jgi:predicted small secreted protein
VVGFQPMSHARRTAYDSHEEKRTMRTIRTLLCLAALASIAAATGCNTTEGFGKDLEAGGRSIKDSAREHND